MTNILNTKKGIIVHQVNCKGVMGCGIASAIRKKWPKVYFLYKKEANRAELGNIQAVKINDELFVVNMFSQFGYGRDKRYTDYDAIKTCLEKTAMLAKLLNLDVYIPYKVGCGNAGGNWATVLDIINKTIPKAKIIHKGN